MFEINGKYANAKFLTDEVDYSAIEQVRHLCNLDVLEGYNIRIMPDVCPGIGTPIGSTFSYTNKVLPSLVSGDIGCGIISCKLNVKKIEFQKLDAVIRENLIARKRISSIVDKNANTVNLKTLNCSKFVSIDRCYSSLGELGGGNHFLEIDKGSDGYLWITVHSGSRLLGQQIYNYYIDRGDQHNTRIFSCLTDELMEEYIYDAEIATDFAAANRMTIIDIICKFLKIKVTEVYHSKHNYIDSEHKIIRKGAISAQKGEKIVIPISASPVYGGVILGKGKGSEEWNYSAPHGAGRLFSRSDSKEKFSLSEFKKNMNGVYSKIDHAGIDEAPMVYKKREYIQNHIKNLVEIDEILIPVYNFKN